MNEISHEIKLWSTLYDDVFILTLFCLPKNEQSYHNKRAKCPEKKITIKSCDSRYYRDNSRPKTDDNDRFQFGIREYIYNALI